MQVMALSPQNILHFMLGYECLIALVYIRIHDEVFVGEDENGALDFLREFGIWQWEKPRIE